MTQPDPTALAACPNPWCGHPGEAFVTHMQRLGFRVTCVCGVRTPLRKTASEAIAAWNTRTALASPTFAAGVEAAAKCAEAEARDCPTGTIEHSTAWEIVKAIRALRPTPAASPAPDSALGDGLGCYDAGLLNDYGGGNVEWWQDYIRAELERAHEYYTSHSCHPAPRADDALRLRNEGARALAQGTQP